MTGGRKQLYKEKWGMTSKAAALLREDKMGIMSTNMNKRQKSNYFQSSRRFPAYKDVRWSGIVLKVLVLLWCIPETLSAPFSALASVLL